MKIDDIVSSLGERFGRRAAQALDIRSPSERDARELRRLGERLVVAGLAYAAAPAQDEAHVLKVLDAAAAQWAAVAAAEVERVRQSFAALAREILEEVGVAVLAVGKRAAGL